jgi:GT2 family glycosyltransferase
MGNKEKIGVGIITCDRPDFFLKCFKSIPSYIDHLVVINDGYKFEDWKKLLKIKNFHYEHNRQNIGVGKSKNKALKYLLHLNCEHIFIIEDDIIIKDPDVFKKYIEARNITGIQHFNFGYHGPANRGNVSGGTPSPRFVVDYGKVQIAINMHSVGAFNYYTREVLEKVGLIDEEYTNAFEHVDHDYRIANAGYCTPYWNWPDLANSFDLLNEIECSEKSSVIRPRKDWQENIQKGFQIFQKKHTFSPAWQNSVPDSTPVIVKRIMQQIYKKYSKQK